MAVAVHVRQGLAAAPSRLTPTARAGLSPLLAALAVAGTNLVASILWILTSSAIAARLAGSVAELQRIEQLKGLAFVVGMSLLLFSVTWLLMRRVERQGLLLEQQRHALAESEARALAGVVASAAAHDMNNVLGMVSGQLDLAGMEGLRSERLATVSRGLDRLAELARKMQSFGRAALPLTPADLDLSAVVREAAALVNAHPSVAGCELRVETPPSLPFVGDELLVSRIVTNLVLNAGEAVSRAGRGHARGEAEAAAPDGPAGRILVRLTGDSARAVLEVHDDGTGVPPEWRERILEPFQTTKRRGTGLGLVSVRTAAQEHGGRVEVGDSELGGARFRVELPAAGGTGG